MVFSTIAQTGLIDHIFAPVQWHEVHQPLCRSGNHAKQYLLAGLLHQSWSLRLYLPNRKESKRKGHICAEIYDRSQRPCGGGTSNMVGLSNHIAVNMVSTWCQHFVLGQYWIRHGAVSDTSWDSIGYVMGQYWICSLVLPIYLCSLGAKFQSANQSHVYCLLLKISLD